MTVTPLTPIKRCHEKDIFQVEETIDLDADVALRIEARKIVGATDFDSLVNAAKEVYDSFTDDDPSWRIRDYDFNEDEQFTQFVLHEVTRLTPDGETTFVAPAREMYRSLVFGDTPDDASFEVQARLAGRGMGRDEEVRVSIPSTGSDDLSPAEARSLAQTLEANATDSAFHVLVNADSAEGVFEAAANLRRAAGIIKLRDREELVTE